jgi:hypothetical protein
MPGFGFFRELSGTELTGETEFASGPARSVRRPGFPAFIPECFRHPETAWIRRSSKVVFFSWTVGPEIEPGFMFFRELSGWNWLTELFQARSVRRPGLNGDNGS